MIRSTTVNLFMASGSETSRKFRILKEQIRQSGRQLQKKKKKKVIGFTYLLKKEKNSKLKRIKRAKHTKEKLKCENQKSINRAPFRVSADEI